LQALLGAMLFRRFVGVPNPFDRFNSTLTFSGIAPLMCLVGSTCGVTSLWLGSALPGEALFGRWWTWWVGDTCGVLVMTPLILNWWRPRWPDWGRYRWIEAVLLFIGVALFTMSIFVWWHPAGQSRYPADILILPVVAWVAYRFTQRELTLVVLVILAIALWGTVHGSGPYRGSTPWSTLPVMQAFIGVLSVLSITIGAVITERKDAGDALQVSEHWLRESQRISRIGSYVIDFKSGRWTSSEILDEIFGIDSGYPRSLEGWAALSYPDDRPGLLVHLRDDAIDNGREFQSECRILRQSDGQVRWVLCRGELSVDGKGSLVKMTGTVLDVTERRNMEAQLLQAQKMESIGRLAGGVAHDFNNLLTVINGYGDLLLSQLRPDDELHRQVGEIRKAGERAADLTMQLLAFSRKQVLQPRVVSLNDIVRDSDRMLRRLIGEDIELRCVLDPGLRPVAADPGQLHQVIVNLAVNAQDAMPNGGKLIIETANCVSPVFPAGPQSEAAGGNFVSLTVHDTGHGMDAATLEHVFEPFFTTKALGKGTGLGLATVYGIVQQSAGHISVHSELGRGATFTIHLPAVDGTTPVEAASEPFVKGSETVLLVEDEEEVRRYLITILRSHGYRVMHAADGEEAIRKFHASADRIDLLITDVVMPRMRGPELASRLKILHSEMKVLYISGYTDPLITDPASFGAGSHYLQKPFARDALVRAVREALRPQ
jgi:two-component system, cell cycle sensor histidine kinase and response regulator CckA